METAKIILENNIESDVNGIFYIYGSKYYYIYTEKELDENNYVKLYVVQVCKEIQNTPTGPIETGNMLGMEITNEQEWSSVQESITKIVEDKKNNTQNKDIKYLPANMLQNLKIISKNRFKLMKHIIEDNFKIIIESKNLINNQTDISLNSNLNSNLDVLPPQTAENNTTIPLEILTSNSIEPANSFNSGNEVIIDYRTKFFEEQEKNRVLEEQLKLVNQKLENIKSIIG